MKITALTDWYHSSVKPASDAEHIGVYKVRRELPDGTLFHGGYAHWDGNRWGWTSHTIKGAYRVSSNAFAAQDKQWRGLNSKPTVVKQ